MREFNPSGYITDPEVLEIVERFSGLPKQQREHFMSVGMTKHDAAAFLFARVHRDAAWIAETLGVSVTTLYRWSKAEAFRQRLTAWGYKGPVNFQVKRRGKLGMPSDMT